MPVLSRARSLQLRPGRAVYAPFVAVAATVAACFAISTQLEAPDTVAHLTVVNPTEWAARVAVASAADGAAVPVGTVEQSTTRTFTDVLDHAGRWFLRFSYGGVEEDVAIDRSSLASAGWKVEVPDGFAARLREAGLPPTPKP